MTIEQFLAWCEKWCADERVGWPIGQSEDDFGKFEEKIVVEAEYIGDKLFGIKAWIMMRRKPEEWTYLERLPLWRAAAILECHLRTVARGMGYGIKEYAKFVFVTDKAGDNIFEGKDMYEALTTVVEAGLNETKGD